MTSACPRQCMHTYAAPVRATTPAMSGSARPPDTSLTRRAPAATACSATTARVVSTETTAPSAARAATTGRTRASSCSTGTRPAPGRVDSPPTSRMSAPSSRSRRPCATAASGSYHSPPSENESGVTLTTPMTSVRSRRASSSSPATGGVRRTRAAGSVLTASAAQDEAHRLGPGRGVAHLAAHRGRHGARARLAHAAHRHAQVLALDDDDRAARLQVLDERVGDLGRQALLDLGAAREHLDEARELGEPGDPAVDVGDVADVRDAVERHEVVLARRVHLDVLDEHHLLVTEVERRREDVGRLLAQPREDLAVGARDARRRLAQALAVRVLADGEQQLAHGGLGPVGVVGRHVGGCAQVLRGPRARDAARGAVGGHQPCPGPATSVTPSPGSPRPRARSSGESAGTSPTRSGGSSSFAAAASSCGMTGEPLLAAFSASVRTGPRWETARCSLDSHTSRGSRLTTGENTRASSAWLSVSFSSSSSTSASSTSRYCVSTSHASSCADSTSLRTSWSTVPATDSE